MTAPRMTISSYSVPGQWGGGVNLRDVVEAVRPHVELDLCALASYPGVPTHEIPVSWPASLLPRIPRVRRRTDSYELLATRSFDRHVAQRLGPADIVHGETGTCLRTLSAAHEGGALCVLDCITTHIDNVVEHQRSESAFFGVRPQINDAVRRDRLAEYELADVLRLPSEFSRRTFLERGVPDNRLVVVRPVVEPSGFPRATFDDDCFRVTSAGRLVPMKGFHYLIEAYERLGLAGAELELWGAPTSRPVGRYLAEHQRRTPTFRLRAGWSAARGVEAPDGEYEALPAVYAECFGRASVFVHATVNDTFGYVVAEAMACGLPVIVTDQAGAAELVRDGISGYVVPARDPDAIADRLRHLYEHRELLAKMGAEARRDVAAWGPAAFRAEYLGSVLGVGERSPSRPH